VRERLDGGDPVMAFVDLSSTATTRSRTSRHARCCSWATTRGTDATGAPNADADASIGVVYTSDSEFETVRTPPLSRSRTARSSDAVVPLSNRYPVPEGDPTIDTAEATERAIRAAATYVVDPGETPHPLVPGATYGAAGIRALAEVEATLYGNALAALDRVRTYPS
jgi:hypothetical protein